METKKVMLGSLYGFPLSVEIPEAALPDAERYCREYIHEMYEAQMKQEIDPALAKAFGIPFETKHYEKKMQLLRM